MATLNLSAPWVIFYRKVNAMFEKDYDIKVVYDDIVYDNTDGSKPELKLYVNGSAKASALTELLPSEKNFGGVTLKISVIPANLNNNSYRSRRRKVYTIDSPDTDDIFHKAFTGNKAFVEAYSIGGVFDNPICYVIFAKEVVQFFTDDIGDANGICSTLYQEIAKDIFVHMDGVYYCTNVDDYEP